MDDGLHNLIGGLAAGAIQVSYLVPFAAGNFVYIGATDLIPQLTATEDWRKKAVHTFALVLGLAVLLAAAVGERR